MILCLLFRVHFVSSNANRLIWQSKIFSMKFTEAEVKQLAENYYQLDSEVKALPGFDDSIFLLEDKKRNKYIFKIASAELGYYFLEAEVAISKHLKKAEDGHKFQHYIISSGGKELVGIQHKGKEYYLRVLTYLTGDFLGDKKNPSNNLLLNLGKFMGGMDASLVNFQHLAANRYLEWDLKNALDARKNLRHIKSHENRRIVSYFLLQFEMEVLPHLSSLRCSIIHNDANDFNVLVAGDTIAGLIDFGDLVYTQVINNLAIACTYALLDNNNPLDAAIRIVNGYHQKFPLTEKEIEVLYYLIAARLCISLTKSAYNASISSGNSHHFLTERPAWELINKWVKINPIKANNDFRITCGYSSVINEGDNYEGLLNERKQFVGKDLSVSYNKNLKIVKGALQYLYDDKGNTYLDCVNNVSHVGHCHPRVVKAMQKQIAVLNTNTRYLNDHIVEYAKRLTATLPKHLSVCYFTNSGSEANDLAIRMSRHFTKAKDVIVLDHAYHGNSTVAMELSPYKFDGKGGGGKMPYIHKAQNPDLYRGEFRYGDKEAGAKYAKDVKRIIDDLEKENKIVAAFICETILGVGGQIPLPENYLKKVYKYVKDVGGVCIADEVQVGFGRAGSKFWGFELQDCSPDIVVLGKPIGNGHPLAAVITTQEIADNFNNGMEYFNTFGGNPVSMIAGLTVLDVIQEEELQKNALEVGSYLLDGLKKLMDKYSIIGDVRGYGLFVGVEMVKDRQTQSPAVPEIDMVLEKMKDRGFLINTDGPLHNVLKIKPPVIFSKENTKDFVAALDTVLSEI
jgi:4-aminobutyrate aminotransferase-like enzyme/Ser/Thr protein kinase RdoA (MazF antagonist)